MSPEEFHRLKADYARENHLRNSVVRESVSMIETNRMLCQTRHIFLVWTVEYCDRQCQQREQEAACRSVLHQIDNVNRGRVRKITIVYMLQF